MRLFKKKKKPDWRGPMGTTVNSEWWQKLVSLYRKDINKEADPEKDAQAIYSHWIKSFLSK